MPGTPEIRRRPDATPSLAIEDEAPLLVAAATDEHAPLLGSDTGRKSAKKDTQHLANFLIRTQLAYNILNTLAYSCYTSATMITDAGGLEPDTFGLNRNAIYYSIPIAVIFALAETYVHYIESSYFNENDERSSQKSTVEMEEGSVAKKSNSLTPLQWLCVALHYGSDVWTGAAVPLALAQQAGFNNTPIWSRGLTYSMTLFYSGLGNAQEIKNAITAFKEANEKKEEARVARLSN